jgi:hypothetical protein
MSDSSEQISKLDARDNRRWLIGVCISVTFGLFGVVMALLSYAHRSPPTPAAAPAARSPATPVDRDRDRETRRQRR